MTKQGFSYSLFLISASLWWGWTILIDIVVIPSVFKTINDFFNAGELGVVLFTRLNSLEVILGSLLVLISSLQLINNKSAISLLLSSVAALLIVLFYLGFLTEKIAELTGLWKQAELLNQPGIGEIKDIQQEHQYWHHLYIGLDFIKLSLLTFILFFTVIKKRSWV